MTAEPIAPLPPNPAGPPAGQLVAVARLRRALETARSYGPLRACTPDQAPIIRLAAEVDRRVLPRWQRGGDGHHEWADPEDYAGLHGWSSRQHWLDVVVVAAVNARPEILEARHVAPATFLHWADTISLHAHLRTGRRCIVRPDKLAVLMGVCKRTVQRCQKAAEDLGLYVVVLAGRMLNEDEVRLCREQGSRQRGLSNDAALVVPAWLASKISMPVFARKKADVTPTSGRGRSAFKLTVISSLTPRSAGKSDPTPSGRSTRKHKPTPPPPQTGSTTPPGAAAAALAGSGSRRYDLEALALARELVLRLPWLHDVAPGRLEPSLRRFVRCRVPWTARDLATAFDQRNHRLGRASMTRELIRHPLGLLATYLDDLDVDADHPLGPDYVPDPTRPRRTELSRIQQANAARTQAARQAAEASTPEHVTQVVTQIRASLRRARTAGTDSTAPPDALF